ncbi:hypothetical protein vseg_013363 [Gypsophila vaccaria]
MLKLSAHSLPDDGSIPSGFAMPETIQGNFEIKPTFQNLVEQNLFGGNATEDPCCHMQMFTDYCSTIKQAGITQNKIREMLFPFSLREPAREWITNLNKEAAGITDWNSLAFKFYQKYYPPERTNHLRSQITSFKQAFDESLGEAWERYKKLIRECPHHGLGTWLVVMTFYNGLFDENRAIIDSVTCGRFANNINDDKASALIEEMAVHSSQYGKPRDNSRQSHSGTGDREALNAVVAQLSALSAKIDNFSTDTSAAQPILALTEHDSICESCDCQGHHASECMGPYEQVNASQNWLPNAPYQNQPEYDRSFLSYRSQNVLNPQPLSPSQQPYVPPHRSFQQPQQSSQFQRSSYNAPHPDPSNSDMTEIKELLKQSISVHARKQETKSQILTHNKILDTQIAKLAKAKSALEKLPEQPHETLNAVTVRGEVDDDIMEGDEKRACGGQLD